MAHLECAIKLHCSHKTALFLTLSKQTRQTIAGNQYQHELDEQQEIHIRLLNVVFTKVCSRGDISLSLKGVKGGRMELLERKYDRVVRVSFDDELTECGERPGGRHNWWMGSDLACSGPWASNTELQLRERREGALFEAAH